MIKINLKTKIVKRDNGKKKFEMEEFDALKGYGLNSTDKAVYLIISDFDNCYATYKRIANALEVSESQIKKSVRKLKDAGLIKTESSRGRGGDCPRSPVRANVQEVAATSRDGRSKN